MGMHMNISMEDYRKLLADSIKLQKADATIEKMAGAMKEKTEIISNLRKSVTYYKKLAQKPSERASVSILNPCLLTLRQHFII